MIKIDIDKIISEIIASESFFKLKGKVKRKLSLSDEELEAIFYKKGIIKENLIEISKDDKYDRLKKCYSSKLMEELKGLFIDSFLKEVRVCPYCGKTPLIKERFKTKGRLFDLDHFFPKNIYPILSVNFFNLIPICKGCNFQKLEIDPLEISRKGKVFHPYFGIIEKQEVKEDETFNSLFSFNDGSGYGLKNLANIGLNAHDEVFKTSFIYLNSEDTRNEFLFILDKRNKIKEAKELRGQLSINDNSKLIEFFFNYYYPKEIKDILTFSNGKFKRDLVLNISKNL